MDGFSVSIILPVLNEEGVDKKLDELMPHINAFPHEVIVVDDSSDDKFLGLKKSLEARKDVRLIKGDREGKGAAIRKAALESTGSVVFYIDSDFRIPLENIRVFINLIVEQGYDLVVAQRPLDKTPRTPMHLGLSSALSWIVQLLIFHSTFFYDTQCGFKAFKGKFLRKFAHKQSINGGMFDIEYLYMARSNKLRIDKVAVLPLAEIRPSRIKVWQSLAHHLMDLFKIKAQGLSGFYKEGYS